MVRYLPILLGACIATVSGLIGAVGVRALAHHEKVSVAPTVMTFRQFINERPENTYHYELTNLRAGTSVYPNPIKPDGEWEKVYVCLFSADTRRLGNNYTSIIAEIDGVSGINELAAFLQSGNLDAYYWPERQQDLPNDIYNRMARKYSGMNFKECVHIEAGGPEPSPDFGNSCIYVGIGGVSLSVICVVLFYVFKLIRAVLFRTSDPWYDEEEVQITNKAGLPTA